MCEIQCASYSVNQKVTALGEHIWVSVFFCSVRVWITSSCPHPVRVFSFELNQCLSKIVCVRVCVCVCVCVCVEMWINQWKVTFFVNKKNIIMCLLSVSISWWWRWVRWPWELDSVKTSFDCRNTQKHNRDKNKYFFFFFFFFNLSISNTP